MEARRATPEALAEAEHHRRLEANEIEIEYLNDNHGVMATASGELTGEACVEAVRVVNEFAVKTKPLCYSFFAYERLTAISISGRGILSPAPR